MQIVPQSEAQIAGISELDLQARGQMEARPANAGAFCTDRGEKRFRVQKTRKNGTRKDGTLIRAVYFNSALNS
jgi:hypothetical protein